MASYSYIQNQKTLKKFLKHIQDAGIPKKVTQAYLTQVGFTSTNDRPIIGILKGLEMLDSSGVPTSHWQSYRDKSRAPAILGALVKSAYSDLFQTYPDANAKDEEALRNFFSGSTSLGDAALTLAVRTFKTLVELSTFDNSGAAAGVSVSAAKLKGEDAGLKNPIPVVAAPAQSASGTTININIELAIPPTDDPKIYDAFFAAMRKNLFPNG